MNLKCLWWGSSELYHVTLLQPCFSAHCVGALKNAVSDTLTQIQGYGMLETTVFLHSVVCSYRDTHRLNYGKQKEF